MQKLHLFDRSVSKPKRPIIIAVSVVIVAVFVFSFYTLFIYLNSSGVNAASLKSENESLKNQLEEIVSKYKILNQEINELSKTNSDLRIAANLPPLSEDELKVGVGGGYFDNSVDFLSGDIEEKLSNAISFVDEVSRKVSFEKAQFLQISEQLKENEKLSESIPAIRPCEGIISDGFGLRYHPILHIRRMHDGLDFITDRGTSVYATGNGKVCFVGIKGGYGLAVEIDHGFGYRTIYAHLSQTLIKVGSKVSRGDIIAKTGTSGLSTGPHLHYEVEHNGIKVNPAEFFFDDLAFFELTAQK